MTNEDMINEVVNTAYLTYNDHDKEFEWYQSLTEVEQDLVAFGALNTQVLNGGFSQYFYNQYEWLAEKALTFLTNINTPLCLVIAGLLEEAVSTKNRMYGEGDVREADEDIWESIEVELDSLDDEYYRVDQEALIAEIFNYLPKA